MARKKKITFCNPGMFIKGDCFEVLDFTNLHADYCFLDPPYEPDILVKAWERFDAIANATTCFMYSEQTTIIPIFGVGQVCHWVKPVSTKNTTKKYSRFIEAIVVNHGDYFNQTLHWSTRTGVFTDTLVEKHNHPHQKPFSLVEKLVLLHTPPGGTVLDPFCGSQVVKAVCDKHGFRSLSIDMIDHSR